MAASQPSLRSVLAGAGLGSLFLLVSCAGSAADGRENEAMVSAAADTPQPGTLAYDKNLWHELLGEHAKIRRVVRHTEKGVEAVTESDDPAVVAKIVEHAKAMQTRMKSGARVRVWDPVFAELFEKHGAVTLEVTPTDKGVRIVESSDDPQVVALLRSHAMGVSEFVREGFTAAPRETPKFKIGDPLPGPELAIGGVPHRILLTQPDAGQLAAMRASGVDVLVNFRKPTELGEYDEKGTAASLGMEYCSLPYQGAAELTDELLDSARSAIKAADEKGEVAALHCRTGNRIGPGWAAYRVLDKGVPVEQAIGEAKAMQMRDPQLEAKVRDYIHRKSKVSDASGGWAPVAADSLTPAQQAQRVRAVEARDVMFARLFAALSEAMSKPGPEGGAAGAIGVCKEEAPKIARAVASEKGVKIGRTSFKLRNPGNTAPAWATTLLVGMPSEPKMAAHNGELGVVLPIKLGAGCLACHGAPEQMEPAVKAALASKYPNDQATGFKEGDLRGWFWVEVPG